MKTIEITFSPNGQTRVETKGFTGAGCREASRFVEQALGQRIHDTLKPEFHQNTAAQQQLQHGT